MNIFVGYLRSLCILVLYVLYGFYDQRFIIRYYSLVNIMLNSMIVHRVIFFKHTTLITTKNNNFLSIFFLESV